MRYCASLYLLGTINKPLDSITESEQFATKRRSQPVPRQLGQQTAQPIIAINAYACSSKVLERGGVEETALARKNCVCSSSGEFELGSEPRKHKSRP